CGCDGRSSGPDCERVATLQCLSTAVSFVPSGTSLSGIDLAAADACADQWVAGLSGCANSRPYVCDRVLLTDDDVELGEPCATSGPGSYRCADGAGVCVWGVGPTATCAELPELGEVCVDQCAGSALCIGGICGLPRGEGQPCSWTECEASLVCAAGVCRARGSEGAMCDPFGVSSCAAGLACIAGRCQTPPEACTDASQCGAEAYCTGASVTRCRARAALGESCSGVVWGEASCVDGTYCDGLRCVAMPLAGASCGPDYQCAAGLACDPYYYVCAPIPGEGAACATGAGGMSVCAAGLGCDYGTCRALPAAGQPCNPEGRCAAGLRCAWDPFSGRSLGCQALSPVGGTCGISSDCESGNYCDLSTSRCAARTGMGQSCWAASDCDAGTACVAGYCQLAPAVGSACSGWSAGECGTSGFCASVVEAGRCQSYFCGY
ncbi:MAG: hypothetical protein IT379_22855, partial [Deltaproteobacteria bacterium]|nr:hypothetical protein [Deltaproteobacteria bacterium]